MDEESKTLPARLAGVNLPERAYYPAARVQRARVPGPYTGGDEGERGHEGSLRDILYVLFRHKWKIVFVFLLLSSAVVLYIASLPPLYEAEGRVFIRGERTGVIVDPTGEGNSFLKAARDSQSSVRSEIGIMKSAMLAEQAVDRLGPDGVLGVPGKEKKKSWLERSPRWVQAGVEKVGGAWDAALDWMHLVPPQLTRRQAAVQAIMRGLDVQPNMTESYVLLVTYRSPDPENARQVLDALLAAYQQEHITIHKNQVSPEFFQAKITELKSALDAKENLLDSERKRLNISSLETQKAMLLTKFNTYDQALKENAMRISSLKAKIGELEQLTARRSKPTKDGKRVVSAQRTTPYLDQLRGRLVELRMKEGEMALRLTDANPDLIALRDQIKQVEGMIKGELTNKDSMTEDVLAQSESPSQDMEVQVILAKAELQAENAREALLSKELNTAEKDLNKLMENEKELKGLERDVAILETDYKQYANSQQTAVISDALDRDKISNVAIVQQATLPTEPVKSQRKLLAVLGFGILMSLAGGLGWAFALDASNHSIKTSEEAERLLGLPVLVAIPHRRHHKPLLYRGNPA